MTPLKQLPHQARFLTIIIIVFIGMWMWITPLYNYVLELLKVPIWFQVLLGAVVVFTGIKIWKLHPW